MIDTFNIRPDGYKEKIDKIITLISTDLARTKEGLDILQKLVNEVENMAESII